MKYVIALLGFLMAVTSASAQTGYTLRPGDVLRIEVLEDPSLNRETLVLPDGTIALPLVGLVQAGGRGLDAVQAEITQKLTPNFAAAPTVYVGIAQLSSQQAAGGAAAAPAGVTVFLMGEFSNPGKLNVEPGSTLLQVLAQSGGMTNFAAKKRIQLRRGTSVYNFDYTQVEKAGTAAGFDTVVTEGDVIVIPTRRLFE